jgi:hypothetical protein
MDSKNWRHHIQTKYMKQNGTEQNNLDTVSLERSSIACSDKCQFLSDFRLKAILWSVILISVIHHSAILLTITVLSVILLITFLQTVVP